jgi:hypothetical protein
LCGGSLPPFFCTCGAKATFLAGAAVAGVFTSQETRQFFFEPREKQPIP